MSRNIPLPLPTCQSGRGSRQNAGHRQECSNAQMSSLKSCTPSANGAVLCCRSWQHFQAKCHSHSEPKKSVQVSVANRRKKMLPGSFFLSLLQVEALLGQEY